METKCQPFMFNGNVIEWKDGKKYVSFERIVSMFAQHSQFNQMFTLATTAEPVKVPSRKYSSRADRQWIVVSFFSTHRKYYIYFSMPWTMIFAEWRCFSSFPSNTFIHFPTYTQFFTRLERKIELFATIATFCRRNFNVKSYSVFMWTPTYSLHYTRILQLMPNNSKKERKSCTKYAAARALFGIIRTNTTNIICSNQIIYSYYQFSACWMGEKCACVSEIRVLCVGA